MPKSKGVEESGYSVYRWTETATDVLITEHEDGTELPGWSWPIEKRDVARVFWETLKSETEKRGDLRATFVEATPGQSQEGS